MTIEQQETKVEAPQEKPEATLAQQKSDTPPQQAVEGKTPEESKEDPNWRAFREARKKDRLDREAAERKASEKEAEVAALKAAMEAAFSKQSPVVSHNEYGYQQPQEESEDERIEKKVNAAIAIREAAAERARQQREQQEYPQRLQQSYPDFNAVISPENLDYLEYHYPEVARPLKRLGDGFDKWADIYMAIKKFVPNHSTARKESAKADANFNKPKSMSSVGTTQDGKPQGGRLTEDQKAANWARMQKMLKGVG